MKFRPIHYYDLAVNVSTADCITGLLDSYNFCTGEIFTRVIFSETRP